MANVELYVNALVKKFDADRATAVANLNTYLTNPVGVGEHGKIVEEMEQFVKSIAEADGNLAALKSLIAEKDSKKNG